MLGHLLLGADYDRTRESQDAQRDLIQGDKSREELIAERDRRLADTRERNPSWGWLK